MVSESIIKSLGNCHHIRAVPTNTVGSQEVFTFYFKIERMNHDAKMIKEIWKKR